MQNINRFTRTAARRAFRMLAVLGICSLFMLHAVGQEDGAALLTRKFDNYRKQNLQEKLFVHTDKNVYLAGEILWFKLYDVDAFFHMAIGISSVAYVEVLDQNNKPVLQAKLALSKGDGDGSLFLPVTMGSGNYKLRAYTNWMKNAGPAWFFEKPLTIINAQKVTDSIPKSKKHQINIGFFPEGGNLVNGIPARVAFHIYDQYGTGVDAIGKLVDNNRDTLQSFHPLKFGIGNFVFTPVSGHSYKAVITFADGAQLTQDLPPGYDKGYAMQVSPAGNGQIEITVHQAAAPGEGTAPVYLFVHTRGVIKWVGSKSLQQGQAVFLVDSSKLGEGISQLTVFDNNKHPVCERLYFRYPQNNLQIAVHPDQVQYDCRKKVSLSVLSGDQSGKAGSADMSLSVYRLDSLQLPDELTIGNYLWLSSDLSGGIESPGYYFKNVDAETMQAMDNLMLTNGWRRFNWDDVLNDKKPTFNFTPEFNGHVVTGRIVDTRTGAPAKKMDTYLSAPGMETVFRNAQSDDQGNLRFEVKNFYGSPEIIVQTNTQQDSNYRFEVTSPFSDKYSTVQLPHFSMPEKSPVSLLYASISTQVQNLFIDTNLRQFRLPFVDTAGFYAEPDYRYMLDDYTRFTTLEEIIREYVLSVNIFKRDGKFHLVVTNKFTRQHLENDPLVLIDGVPVFNLDKFLTGMDPLKLYKLEVVATKYFYGNKGFDGVLNFTTYKGDLAGYELDPQAIALDYEGLQMQRKFYAPVYDTEQQAGSHQPDFRNLLYWSPEVRTGNDGKWSGSFYTSDIPGTYAVILQGIDAGGRTGSQVLTFEVKAKSK